MLPSFSYAHPGRTDASGCHTCRTNCANWGLSTGEYHCHNAKALPQPEEPIRSHYGEGRTGTTEPWPEYKTPKVEVVEKKPVVPEVQTFKEKPEEKPAVSQVQVQEERATVSLLTATQPKKQSWLSRFFSWLF